MRAATRGGRNGVMQCVIQHGTEVWEWSANGANALIVETCEQQVPSNQPFHSVLCCFKVLSMSRKKVESLSLSELAGNTEMRDLRRRRTRCRGSSVVILVSSAKKNPIHIVMQPGQAKEPQQLQGSSRDLAGI